MEVSKDCVWRRVKTRNGGSTPDRAWIAGTLDSDDAPLSDEERRDAQGELAHAAAGGHNILMMGPPRKYEDCNIVTMKHNPHHDKWL